MPRKLCHKGPPSLAACLLFYALVATTSLGFAQAKKSESELVFPPKLPGDQQVVTDQSDEFLNPPATIKADVAIAKTPPTVDFLFFPANVILQHFSDLGDQYAALFKDSLHQIAVLKDGRWYKR